MYPSDSHEPKVTSILVQFVQISLQKNVKGEYFMVNHMFKRLSFFLLFALGSGLHGLLPEKIIVIRNSETTESGNHLNQRGKERSYALIPFFKDGQIAAIYAEGNSNPCIESVTPLAKSLGLEVITRYNRGEYLAMSQEIKPRPQYDGQVILICWDNDRIPDLIRKFGALKGPEEWPDYIYDRVWVLEYQGDGTVVFHDQPQRLMFQDSST